MPKPKEEEVKKTDVKDTTTEDLKTIKYLTGKKEQYEPRWFMSSAFWEGVHFFSGKKDKAGAFIKTKLPKGKVLREIPKAKKLLKNVRTLLLKPKFTPVVYPDMSAITGEGDEKKKEFEQAKNQGKVVRHVMVEDMKFKRHIKKLVRFAEMYSVGYLQVHNDGDSMSMEVLDPFDVSMDPEVNHVNDTNVIIKHFYKTKEQLEETEIYDQAKVKKALEGDQDNKYANNQFKNELLTNRYGDAPDDAVILDEAYRLEKDEAGDTHVTVKTYANNQQIRKEEHIKTKLTKLPFSVFCWEDEIYTTSLLEELMPMNKAYDKFITKLEEKVNKLGTGRMLLQAKEPTKVITTKDGEILRYKRTKPDIMREADISNAYMEVINVLQADMNEQGVSAAAGAIPPGVKAWHAIEALKEADYSSIGTQQDNLEECIVDITEKVTEMIAFDTITKKTVQPVEKYIEKTSAIQYIGARGKEVMTTGTNKEDISDEVTVIDPNRTTKVEVESAMAYSEVAKKDMAMELASKEIIPVEVLIDILQLGNSEEIIDRMKELSTQGKSIIDMPEFKMLPMDLQKAITVYLDQGGAITDPNIQEVDDRGKSML